MNNNNLGNNLKLDGLLDSIKYIHQQQQEQQSSSLSFLPTSSIATQMQPTWASDLNIKIDTILNLMFSQSNNNISNGINSNSNSSLNGQYIGNDKYILLFVSNCNIRVMNKRNILYNDPILPLYKVNEGIGNFNNLSISETPSTVPMIGWTPINFPTTYNQRLTPNEVSELSRFYNDDFGITEFDNIIEKNKKFYLWIHSSKFNTFNNK